MNVHLSQTAIEGLFDAPLPVQKAFIKQINYLVRNLKHPSLRAKKFDEAKGRWQARINDDWRFYFWLTPSAPCIAVFGAQYPACICSCPTLQVQPHDCPRMARGQDGRYSFPA